jgi:hypothetical protein
MAFTMSDKLEYKSRIISASREAKQSHDREKIREVSDRACLRKRPHPM